MFLLFTGEVFKIEMVGLRPFKYLQAYYPEDLSRRSAAPKYDYGMLLVSLAILLDKSAPLFTNGRVDLRLVLERCRAVSSPELQQLLQELAGLAGWSLP